MEVNSQEFGNSNVPRVNRFYSYRLTLKAPGNNSLWRKPNSGSVSPESSRHCDALTSCVKREGQARDTLVCGGWKKC